MTQARAVGKFPSVLVYVHRDKFLEFNTLDDLCALMGECVGHTKYVEFGRAQLKDMHAKKKRVEAFLVASESKEPADWN